MNTNKQVVSVPRELLDVLRFWLERSAERSEAGELKELVQLRELLRAAPAEDIRAVVDESVSGPNWQACWTDWLANHAEIDPDGFEQHWNGWKAALRRHPQRPVVVPEREALRDAIAQAIGGDAYDCTRVWSAWSVGTMSDDDFVSIVEQEGRLSEIVDACLEEFEKLNGKG